MENKTNARAEYLENIIFFCRWMLAPLNLFMALTLPLFVWKMFLEVKSLYAGVFLQDSISHDDLIYRILGLADFLMIANLVVMLMIGSWTIFIRKIVIEDSTSKPQWLDHINSGALKIKLMLSLIGVMGVHLLKTFIEPAKLNWHDAIIQGSIFILVVIGGFMIAKTDAIMRSAWVKEDHKSKE